MSPAVFQARLSWAPRLSLALATLALAGAALLPLQTVAQTLTLPDFTELAERVGPSVVNIRTTERAQRGAARRRR